MFQLIKELLSLRKSIDEKQELISKLYNSELNYKKSIDALRHEEEKAIHGRETAIKNRDSYLAQVEEERQAIIAKYKDDEDKARQEYSDEKSRLTTVQEEIEKSQQKIDSNKITLNTYRQLYKTFRGLLSDPKLNLTTDQQLQIDELAPTTSLMLHQYDIKSLKKASKENEKIIEETLLRYEKRYTTKTNKAIYQLMVLALRAELQNILISMKYTNLDKCMDSMKTMIKKYIGIATDGNQTIAPTLNNFIAEIEVLFKEQIEIEYEYYTKKEQERQEQQALREQMRQEAEERKALEEQKKQIVKEESKYLTEIDNVNKQLNSCQDESVLEQLKKKIELLQTQLSAVQEKKEEITRLQNGKAGNVYIISNLGSFGENVFKIGMTRRLDPMERVKELGDASVPFAFDVHSFIFSEDAVNLENELHKRLADKRTNKVNLRKEFFNVTIDELEILVQNVDETAEFNRTMLATEFRQSQSL